MSHDEQLHELRASLGHVDAILLDVLHRRAWLVREIQRVKRAAGRPGRDANQEEVVLSRLAMYRPLGAGYSEDVLRRVFLDLMAASEGLDEGAER